MSQILASSFRSPSRVNGFTLIELMIAVAILAIIAAVATPLYDDYADRGFRGEAQGDLLACAQGMERWASANFDYQGAADTNGDGVGDADVGPPATAVCTPTSVNTNRYTITVNGTANSFTLTAAPINNMAGDGNMTIDDAGARRWDQNNNGAYDANEDTWQEH